MKLGNKNCVKNNWWCKKAEIEKLNIRKFWKILHDKKINRKENSANEYSAERLKINKMEERWKKNKMECGVGEAQ